MILLRLFAQGIHWWWWTMLGNVRSGGSCKQWAWISSNLAEIPLKEIFAWSCRTFKATILQIRWSCDCWIFLSFVISCDFLRLNFNSTSLRLPDFLADAKQPVAAEYLNGGFYGGRAEDLEVALRLVILRSHSSTFFNYFFLFPEFQWLSVGVLWICGGISCGSLGVPLWQHLSM